MRLCGSLTELIREALSLASVLSRQAKTQEADRDFLLLKTPARRDVEVLVYAGKWWRQQVIKSGSCKTTIYLGNEKTKSDTEFKVVALTTETPLTEQTYLNLPDYRTRRRCSKTTVDFINSQTLQRTRTHKKINLNAGPFLCAGICAQSTFREQRSSQFFLCSGLNAIFRQWTNVVIYNPLVRTADEFPFHPPTHASIRSRIYLWSHKTCPMIHACLSRSQFR